MLSFRINLTLLLASIAQIHLATGSFRVIGASGGENPNAINNEIVLLPLSLDEPNGESNMRQLSRLQMEDLSGELYNAEIRAQQQTVDRANIAGQQLVEPQTNNLDRPQLVGQRVINGNHATYVEPPADFKPVIYVHKKPNPLLVIDQSSSNNQGWSNNEIVQPSASSNKPISSSELDDLIQPPMRVTADGSMIWTIVNTNTNTNTNNNINENSNENRETNINSDFSGNSLKQNPGRWTDWRDMSVEPDLASSDQLEQQHQRQPQKQVTFIQAAVPAKTPYKIRSKVPISDNAKLIDDDRGSLAGDLIAFESKNVGQSVAAGGTDPNGSSSTATLIQQTKTPGLNSQPGRVNLNGDVRNLLASSASLGHQSSDLHLDNKSSSNIKPTSRLGGNSYQAQKDKKISNESLNEASNEASGANQMERKVKPQTLSRRLRKRRRKSKSGVNAEVRIQQLVQKSERQQQDRNRQQLAHSISLPKQVNGLSGSSPSSVAGARQSLDTLAMPTTNQHQQQQQRSSVSSSRNKNSPVVKRTNGSHHNQHQPQQAQQQNHPLASHSNHPIAAASTATGAVAATAAAAAMVSASPKSQDQLQNVKRSVNKQQRRLKTLLPVGLSSWFLGGIRDLDGRHWHLPSEVINRLAINDVDFTQPIRPTKVESSLGVEILTSEQEETTSQMPRVYQSQHKSSNGQTIPR